MQIKTYDFYANNPIYVKDGDGFKTLEKDVLTDWKNRLLVVTEDGQANFEWEVDGKVYTEFYTKDEYGNMLRIEYTEEAVICCSVYNPESDTRKRFDVTFFDGVLKSETLVGPIIDENGVLVEREITVPPGTYRVAENDNSFHVKEENVFVDAEHASWFSGPKIDGNKVAPRADLVRISTMEKDALVSLFNGLVSFAKSHGIQFMVDEYTGSIRAVKVPEGYKVECEEGYYSDFIPWELMPVIGRCQMHTNTDSEYQPTLMKVQSSES